MKSQQAGSLLPTSDTFLLRLRSTLASVSQFVCNESNINSTCLKSVLGG